ncbi:hypothetical protein [Arcticibacter sp. MXS-1]|uniref:DUF7935 family protein n=1 Tax=Arcticibacter sp. MXS-1 TaxID=3341726 RepID=UPI0035A8E963
MNSVVPFLLDILKLVLSGSLVFFIVFLVLKPYISRSEGLSLLKEKNRSVKITLPLRLQAYERVVLFIERANPASLLLRVQAQGSSLEEFQYYLNNEIRNEYLHNISQQIYVTEAAWWVTRKVKEETIALINNAAKSLGSDASSVELGKAILNHLGKQEVNPYDAAIDLIRKDVEKLF